MLTDEIIKLLENFYLFQGVDLDRLETVTENSQLIALEKDDVLFHRNEAYQQGLYLIVEGKLRLLSDSEHDGVDLSVGDIAGLSTFLSKARYNVTATCEADSTFIFFPESCIYKLISDYSDFKDRLQKLIIDRINKLSGKRSDSVFYSSYKSAGTYMTSPVMKIEADTDITEACRLMAAHKIGSIAVTDENNRLKGLVTSKSVIYKFFVNDPENVTDKSVDKYMNDHCVTVPPEFPLAGVLSKMQKNSEDYAVVVKNGEPHGIISGKDILRVLFSDSTVVTTNIENAKSLDDLKSIHKELYTIADSLMNSSRLTFEILPIISSLHVTIQKKIYSLTAESYLESTGTDVRLIKHAVIVMGSVGRKESMLDPDQDNGYVLPDDISQADRKHLEEFAKLFSANLDLAGYDYCDGGIMVTNSEMSNTVNEWKELIGGWIDNPGEKGLRWSSIIFDMATLVGDDRLVWELREYILGKVSQKPAFLLQMLQKDAGLKIPRSIFGKFIVEKEGKYKGKINLKRAALSFIVDVTRAFSLYKGHYDLNTVDRLKHLERTNALSEDTFENISNAYEVVTDIILSCQIDSRQNGEVPDKFVDPYKLSLYNQEKLKNALLQISKYLSTGLRYFSGSPF
jgi:CBS domain-containing protein